MNNIQTNIVRLDIASYSEIQEVTVSFTTPSDMAENVTFRFFNMKNNTTLNLYEITLHKR